MELIKHFETYILAQKDVGNHFIIIGIGLFIIALLSHFFGSTDLSNGLKIASIICGILAFSGGVAYKNTENKLFSSQTEVYKTDKLAFQTTELARMEKVSKDFPVYQIVFGSFIILGILITWFVKNDFWHGVAFAVIILFSCVMISEAFSKKSIPDYTNILNK